MTPSTTKSAVFTGGSYTESLAPIDPDLAAALHRALGGPARVLVRPLDRAAYASDASVYRLVPQAVVQPKTEDEVRALFALSQARGVPMTFRTAGTSLSGQAVTDGLLVDLSKHWSRVEVLDGGARVRVQPGVIGGHTLAFISEAVLRTLPEYRYHRTGLLLFPTAAGAFAAVAPLERSGARAIEYMDNACLRTVRRHQLLDLGPDELPDDAAALLVEYQCTTQEELDAVRAAEGEVLGPFVLLAPARLTEDAAERATLWKVRKGLIPIVGATKRSGEAVLIEDVAFPLPHLPQATAATGLPYVSLLGGGGVAAGRRLAPAESRIAGLTVLRRQPTLEVRGHDANKTASRPLRTPWPT